MNNLSVFNNDIIPVYTTDTGEKVVIGRELHEQLHITTPYDKWFPRMTEYGFTESKDYSTFLSDRSDGLPGKPRTNHLLKLDMAKHIAMIQRTPVGFAIRQKLIELEQNIHYLIPQNYPSALRALADETEKRLSLENENAQQKQLLAEFSPKASYYDVVLQTPDVISIGKIAKDYGQSAQWLNKKLHELGVQFKQGGVWLLYQKYAQQGYTKSQTETFSGRDGTQHSKLHTYWTQKGRLFIYDLLKSAGLLPLIEQKKETKSA